MNWVGITRAAIVAALLGIALGVWGYARLVALGVEAPWLVGILGGAGCALGARQRHVMSGLLIGTLAVWAAAAAQVTFAHDHLDGSLVTRLGRFHETLTPARWAAFAVTAVAAVWLGSRAPLARTDAATGDGRRAG